MNTLKIKQLIDRFFEGETTLDEERQIIRYFEQEKVDAELESYRDMFLDMALISTADVEQPVHQERRFSRLYRYLPAVAASLLLIVGSVLLVGSYQNYRLERMYGGSYIVENGHRTDNLLRIVGEIKGTLTEADRLEARVNPQKFIDQTEQELFAAIDDSLEQQHLWKLLNE